MILITGLTGTSGRAFYEVLTNGGYEEKIRVVVRATTSLAMFENTKLDLDIVVGDIEDKAFLKTAVKGCRLVMHIAAKGKAIPIAEAIAEAEQKPSAIMISSTIVYSEYYRTSYLKRDESYIRQRFDENGIRYAFVRPTMIFGTKTDRNISVFMKWFSKFKVFPVVGHGRATIQPVYYKDLAAAYYMVLTAFDRLQSDEYIVSGKEEMTLMEMFRSICRVIGKKVYFINIPFPLAKVAVWCLYTASFHRVDYREKLDRLMENRAYGHQKISDELGYAPDGFEENLRKAQQSI